MSWCLRLPLLAPCLLALAPVDSHGQARTLARGRVEISRVQGFALEGNLTGEAMERTVAVYLPPSYAIESDLRYPVLVLLHGIGGTHADWVGSGNPGSGWNTIQDVMDRTLAEGRVSEVIVVTVDQRTLGGGSFYTNSELTGAWEDFTVYDLVGYVDQQYRTLAAAESRGIAGHSMGGYGAILLGMKHPDVFQVVFGMGAALLGFATDLTEENPAYARAASMTPAQMNPRSDFWPPSLLCVAQAFSPNLNKPPFFADLPFQLEDGVLRKAEDTYERWRAHMPLYAMDAHVDNLKSLRGLRFEAGYDEEFTHIPVTNRAFSERLTEAGVPHVYEEYNGDHANRLWGEEGRIATELLPYVSRMLASE